MWLTEGVGRSGSQRRGLTTTTGGGAEAVLAEGDDAAVLQAFGPLGSAHDVAARVQMGLGRPKCLRRRGIVEAAELTCGGIRAEIRHVHGSGSEVSASGRFLASGWNRCGGPG